jgi:hypothetical protein
MVRRDFSTHPGLPMPVVGLPMWSERHARAMARSRIGHLAGKPLLSKMIV